MFLKKRGTKYQKKWFVRDTNCLGMTCFQPGIIDLSTVVKYPLRTYTRMIRACANRFHNCPCGEYSQELADERTEDWVTSII